MKKDTDLGKNLVERIYLTADGFAAMERDVLLHEHLRRYGSIRRFCFGDVLDFACGCGYGSFMIAGNPDVERVMAIDRDKDAILWAKKNFSHKKISYGTNDIRALKQKFDTLICLETVEHIKEKKTIPDLVRRCSIDNIIISFPDKKTTHYNPHHFHDFVKQDIVDMFPEHIAYHTVRFVDSVSILLIRLPKKAPHDLFRNIRDL